MYNKHTGICLYLYKVKLSSYKVNYLQVAKTPKFTPNKMTKDTSSVVAMTLPETESVLRARKSPTLPAKNPCLISSQPTRHHTETQHLCHVTLDILHHWKHKLNTDYNITFQSFKHTHLKPCDFWQKPMMRHCNWLTGLKQDTFHYAKSLCHGWPHPHTHTHTHRRCQMASINRR